MQSSQVSLDNSSPDPGLEKRISLETTVAECDLSHVLELESTLARGELSSDSTAGMFLYTTAISPRYLESSTPSRISYLSRLFCQWNGSLQFQLYVTKAIFQQTKLLMVFVPDATPASIRAIPLESLMGYQMRTIMNPDNNSCAQLEVPFVSKMPWLSIDESTGTFAIILAERIITTQQSNSPISWILTVSSPRGGTQIRFRYAVVPPLTIDQPPSGGGGTGIAPPSANPADNSRALIGETYAQSCSSKLRQPGMFTVKPFTSNIDDSSLYSVAPVFGAPKTIVSGAFIPFSGLPASEVVAKRLTILSLSPFFSYTNDAPLTRKSLVPYLPSWSTIISPLPNATYPSWYTTASNNSIEGGCLYFGGSFDAFRIEVKMPSEEIASSFHNWWVTGIYRSYNSQTEMMRLRAEASGSKIILRWKSGSQPAQFSGLGFKVGTPVYFVDDPSMYEGYYNGGLSAVEFLTGQIERARNSGVASHFAVYCGGDENTARHVASYLRDPNPSAVPGRYAQGAYVSLSLSQAPALFNMISVNSETRGIFTWIYSLFSDDSDTAIAKIARVADIILDFALPLLLSYDGEAPPFVCKTPRMEFDNVQIGIARIAPEPVQLVEPEDESSPLGIEPPILDDEGRSIPEPDRKSRSKLFSRIRRRGRSRSQSTGRVETYEQPLAPTSPTRRSRSASRTYNLSFLNANVGINANP